MFQSLHGCLAAWSPANLGFEFKLEGCNGMSWIRGPYRSAPTVQPTFAPQIHCKIYPSLYEIHFIAAITFTVQVQGLDKPLFPQETLQPSLKIVAVHLFERVNEQQRAACLSSSITQSVVQVHIKEDMDVPAEGCIVFLFSFFYNLF